jgi:SAM-dependent methyltransferase
MDDYTASTYGDRIADVYDEWQGMPQDAEEAAAFLASVIPEGGTALELGIGTGRVALPLAARGIRVEGIDASEAMVSRMRAKPGGDPIRVTEGDFARFDLGRTFDAVYVVFNTFFGLLTQEDQVSCFASVARHVRPGGVFVMEAFVPDPARFDRGQRVSASEVTVDRVRLDVSMHDPIEQRSISQHVVLEGDRVRLYPVRIRYAWIGELDLMARLAGLRLRERWGDWDRSALTASSPRHVSVWERP